MTAPIRSMPELLDVIRARRDELNISHETIDSIAGLQPGYASKLLAPKPIKNLGPMSMGAVLGALGIALIAVPDQQAADRVSTRWQKRKRPQKLPVSIPLSIENEVPKTLQVTPEIKGIIDRNTWMSEIGCRGNRQRNNRLSPWHRKMLARRAAKARWKHA